MAEEGMVVKVTTFIAPAIRTVLSAAPYCGAIANAWNEWDTHKRFKHIEQAFALLKQRLDELGPRFDPNRLGAAEMQLLEMAMEKLEREYRDQKRRRFVQIVAHAWSDGFDRPFDEKTRFLAAIDEFDDVHIQTLTYIRDETDKGVLSPYASLRGALGVSDEVVVPVLDKLASGYYFIRRGWELAGGTGKLLFSKGLSPEGIARKCEHQITEAGRRFLDYLAM